MLNTAILTTLISNIKSTLEDDVDSVKEVIAHPFKGNPDNYPAVIFFPDSFDNSFETVADNFKIYAFKMFAIINANSYDDEDIFEDILPKVVDEILEKFDEGWDMGTIGGHRVSALIDTGIWGKSSEDKAELAWVEMNLRVRVLTNN